jgi:hypothetical protein
VTTPIDGFWLPQAIRSTLLSAQTEYVSLSFANGRPCEVGEPGAVTARWPRLQRQQWQSLLEALADNRQQAPQGSEFWPRFQAALQAATRRFAHPSDPLRQQALSALPSYTGYSAAMIRFTLGALDLMSLDQLPAAFESLPNAQAIRGWQSMRPLPGYLRFYPKSAARRLLARLPGLADQPLFGLTALPETVIGFGAGNVPGTSLLIAFLALATALAKGPLPRVIVKNSRNEPIFSPLVLSAMEAVDPQLVATTAVLVWDYEDTGLQDLLLSQADLVIAAASDETIGQILAQSKSANRQRPHPPRFHAHGHKVSFSAISQEVLQRGLADPASERPLLDVIALLAALDSAFWDQHGCLSARIHFVEEGGPECFSALEYAERLGAQLRLLAEYLPRGAWPRQALHDRFDRYKQLETGRQVQVLSQYEDEFVVAIDQRPLSFTGLQTALNDCQGRVILVRPVANLMEIPEHYLRLLPASNLQSLSVALGQPGEGLQEHHLRFAAACGRRGVTALRTVGRGAFPQLSHSWDGLIPLDLIRQRPVGYFTTVEFDKPLDQILETYHLLQHRGG